MLAVPTRRAGKHSIKTLILQCRNAVPQCSASIVQIAVSRALKIRPCPPTLCAPLNPFLPCLARRERQALQVEERGLASVVGHVGLKSLIPQSTSTHSGAGEKEILNINVVGRMSYCLGGSWLRGFASLA